MRSVIRLRLVAPALAACVAAALWAGAAGAHATHHHSAKASPKMFSLQGYVLDAKYTKGRNTGNTFQQTYRAKTVHGVPVAGPYVGTKFPREDYVAMPIGNHELYVAWMSTAKGHPLLDVFVMNFKTHKIWDYAPGSLAPQSTGTVTIVKTGKHKLR